MRGQSVFTTRILEVIDNGGHVAHNPSTYHAPGTMVVRVGPAREVFYLSLATLLKIEHFAMLVQHDCRETVGGHIELPDVDYPIFSKLVQCVEKRDFFPRLCMSPQQCKNLQPTQYYHGATKERFCDDPPADCAELEAILEVVEESRNRRYGHNEHRMGHWFSTEATHYIFDQIARLYCLAERWLMEDLKELCLYKIKMFPLGGRALAVLAEHVVSEVPEGDSSIWNQQLWELFRECVQFHQYPFEARRQTQGQGGQALRKEYKPLLELLKRETALGRSINRILDNARDIRRRAVETSMHYWTCEDERMAVCTLSYTAEDAKGDWCVQMAFTSRQQYPVAPLILKDDNLYPGFRFCPTDAGDVLAKVNVDQPVFGFVYCENKTKLDWGFLPYEQIRYLARRSVEDCECDEHREFTFTYDGAHYSQADLA